MFGTIVSDQIEAKADNRGCLQTNIKNRRNSNSHTNQCMLTLLISADFERKEYSVNENSKQRLMIQTGWSRMTSLKMCFQNREQELTNELMDKSQRSFPNQSQIKLCLIHKTVYILGQGEKHAANTWYNLVKQLVGLELNQLPVFQLVALAVTSGEVLQVWTISLRQEWMNNLPDTLPEHAVKGLLWVHSSSCSLSRDNAQLPPQRWSGVFAVLIAN